MLFFLFSFHFFLILFTLFWVSPVFSFERPKKNGRFLNVNDMKDSDLHRRLIGFLEGKTSSGDWDKINKLAENEEFVTVLRQMDKLSRESCRPDKGRMWTEIYRYVRISRRRNFIRLWERVAVVLLPALIGIVLFFYFQYSRPEQHFIPGPVARNQVRLFLNDGRVVHVQQLAQDSVLRENGVGILIDTGRSVVYQPQNVSHADLVYNTLTVPRCCEYRMVLADGTQVWLNSESELRFPVNFTGNERRVFLKGEAYFQVAKDETKPFRVETGALEIEALGTQFDVNAYRDNGQWMTTLVEGRVRVSVGGTKQTCVLEPGKQALLHNNVLTVSDANVEEITGWKEGRFVFRNMTMENIARQLERWYDVEIGFPDVVVRYYRFTGVMKRYHQLSQLIEMIEETTDVKFQVNGREVKICRR